MIPNPVQLWFKLGGKACQYIVSIGQHIYNSEA